MQQGHTPNQTDIYHYQYRYYYYYYCCIHSNAAGILSRFPITNWSDALMCFGGSPVSSSALVGILYTLFICLLLLLFIYILYFINNTTIVREQRFESAEKCDVYFVLDLIKVCVCITILYNNTITIRRIMYYHV